MTRNHAADFDLDDGVSYLNAAYMSPMPRSAEEAGRRGLSEKMRPWARDRAAAEQKVEGARALAAELIGARADDIAIVNSVSYGIAIACANLPVVSGSRLLVLEDEHHSALLSLRALARRSGAIVDAVLRPDDGNWTQAVLDRLGNDDPPIGVAVLTPVHWMDGTLIDIERIAPRLRARGGRLIVDATQAVGVVPIDMQRWKADFIAFPTYKWLLGPYGCAFLYVAPEHQDGAPFEEHAFNHEGPIVPLAPSAPSPAYTAGARRFDRGEVEGYLTMPIVHAGLSYVTGIGPEAVMRHIAALTGVAAEGLTARGIGLAQPDLRSPHILSFRPPSDADAFAEAMASAGVAATHRYGLCRVSPHIYNTRQDIQKLLNVVETRKLPVPHWS